MIQLVKMCCIEDRYDTVLHFVNYNNYHLKCSFYAMTYGKFYIEKYKLYTKINNKITLNQKNFSCGSVPHQPGQAMWGNPFPHSPRLGKAPQTGQRG